jgi:hypothetical protein
VSERRKQRGDRRYYRKLERWATETVTVDLERDGPFDVWHWHPDLWCRSRPRGRSRRAHLAALFAAFDRLLDEAERASQPLQVFVHVHDAVPGNDALYLHGPNPVTAFPFRFDGYAFDAPIPEWLVPFVDPDRFEFGAAAGTEVGHAFLVGPLSRQYLVVPRGRLGRGAPSHSTTVR